MLPALVMTQSEDTYVDGCGVLNDIPLGEGTRIRLRLSEDRQQDISIFVDDGIVHVYGMYRPLNAAQIEDNHICVDTKVWPKRG
jgi:hypothetical protein